MPDRNRIWMVSRVYSPDAGGVQTYAEAVAAHYAALRWQVTMFAKSSAGPRRITNGRLALIDVGTPSLAGVYVRLFLAMTACFVHGQRPHAIHACTWRAAIPALLFPVPLIVTVHGREIGRPRGLAFVLMRLVLRRADRIVAVSGTTRALLLRRLPRLAPKCVVNWNGVAAASPVGQTAFQSGEGMPTLLTLCRLVPRKNVVTAIRAAALLAEAGGRFVYRIAGAGAEEPGIRRLVDEGGLGGCVSVLGHVTDDQRTALYRTGDIFLHPQIALEGGDEIEGFGLSVADAMAHGMVCIVGAEGGPSELIEDGVTGFIVDGRSPGALQAILDRLFRDAALRTCIGERARRWTAESLSWRKHCIASIAGLAHATAPPRRPRAAARSAVG